MGTTKTELAAGSIDYQWVVAIEGYSNLLTSGSTAAAVTAWAGTDWSAAIGGMFVELDNQQKLDPWNPLQGGGTCTLRIAPDSADAIGIATARKTYGAETYLAAEVGRSNGTIPVKSTSAFAASGEAHIGTECFAYSSVTPTAFQGVTRGRYSPFGASGSTRFAQHHRVGFDANSVKLQPIVSAYPRTWVGRRVGVWMHRRIPGGVLDTKAEAQLVFAGKIAELRGDVGTLGTVIALKHELDVIRETSLGRELWSAKIKAGIYLAAGLVFSFTDRKSSTATPLQANDLVVATPASGTNQMAAGYYSTDEICSRISQWLADELNAARISGSYTMEASLETQGYRSKVQWRIPNGTSSTAQWWLSLPAAVAVQLGWAGSAANAAGGNVLIDSADSSNAYHTKVSDNPPLAASVFYYTSTGLGTLDFNKAEVYDERGTFQDQFDFFPSSIVIAAKQGLDWGIFLLDNRFLVYGGKLGNTLYGMLPSGVAYAGSSKYSGSLQGYSLPYSADAPDHVDIKQIFILEATLANLLKRLFCSTGTADYNVATLDAFVYGLGLGVPYGLLGTEFEASVDALPGANATMVVIVDETTSLLDLVNGDLVLRRAFLLWKDQHIRFGSWRAPSASSATTTLDETNKAAPSGQIGSHRTATADSSEWVRAIVKIDYNRDITAVEKNSGYRDTITLEDRVAVDDAGGEGKSITIKARNTYGQFAATGQGVEDLAPGFLSTMPLFSRPAHLLTRTISSRFFEEIAIGDVVLLTDGFARDPATGLRGLTDRPAIIVAHRWTPGGAVAGGKTSPMGGEVTLMFTDHDESRGAALYAPSADVDNTATNAGYNAGTKTLTCYAHRCTETSEAADASFFLPTYKVRIVERDPADPAAPLVWTDTVASQSGNTITLTTGLSAPAWDATKFYRVTFDDYDVVVASQKASTFQADDATALILATSQPYTYGSEGYAAGSDDLITEVELVPDLVFADGAPRDVGHERALMRQVENLIDYKLAVHAPFLFNSVITQTAYAGMTLAAYFPIFLSFERLSVSVFRYLSVAPFFRSGTGASVVLRVSILQGPPSSATINGVTLPDPKHYVDFVTASTTWQTPTPKDLMESIKHPFDGTAWIAIQLSQNCETRGLARLVEGARQV